MTIQYRLSDTEPRCVIVTTPAATSDDEYDRQTAFVKSHLQERYRQEFTPGNQETNEDGSEECGWWAPTPIALT